MNDVEELLFTLILIAACGLMFVAMLVSVPWVSDAFNAASFVMGVALFVLIVAHGWHLEGIQEADDDE